MSSDKDFEKMWNESPPPLSDVDQSIWESMQPHRVSPSVPDDSDQTVINAFKKEHSVFARTASSDMHMIRTKTICKKCLLHPQVCETIAKHVKDSEGEVLKSKSKSKQCKDCL